MPSRKKKLPDAGEYELLTKKEGHDSYRLRLYVTGMTPRSVLAIDNLKMICEEFLSGRYTLEIVDLYKNPKLAAGEQIVAAPTLIKKLPLPIRRIIGDLSDREQVLVGLDLREQKSEIHRK